MSAITASVGLQISVQVSKYAMLRVQQLARASLQPVLALLANKELVSHALTCLPLLSTLAAWVLGVDCMNMHAMAALALQSPSPC